MTATPNEFVGWTRAGLPVVVGSEPPGAVSLAALADPDQHAQLLPVFISLAGGIRQGALTMVHYAVFAVASVLVAPLVFDHTALNVTSDQLGLVLDEAGDMTAAWIGQVSRCVTDRPAAHLGALAMQLLEPIAEQSRRAGKVSAHSVTDILLDALSNDCRRLTCSCAVQAGTGWVDELISAAGHPEYRPGRPIFAQPDAGAPVEFRVPRTCCVLNTHPSEHACLTCPRHPDDATRLRLINEWLQGLNNDEFREVTGRKRVQETDKNYGFTQ